MTSGFAVWSNGFTLSIMSKPPNQLLQLTVSGESDAWRSVGFELSKSTDGRELCRVGEVQILFEENLLQNGIWRATTQDVHGEIDSLEFGEAAVSLSSDKDNLVPSTHPNGVSRIDHLVVTTPDCDRTTAALEANGILVRRVRTFGVAGSEIRQTFFWLGDVILELVGPETIESEGPALFWGLAFISENIHKTVDYLGDACTPLKPAIQPGRKITTIKTRDVGIHSSLAVMSPHIDSD